MAGDRNIYLIGPMGSGKSAVGRELARLLRRPFLDTDDWIEKRAGMTVAEIFARQGEASFRRLELAAVRRAARRPGLVVALGGGAPTLPEVRRVLAAGFAVRLTCRQRVLWSRLASSRHKRPLLSGGSWSQGRARLAALLRRREPTFPKGELRLSTTRATARAAARHIAGRIHAEDLWA